MKYTALCRPGVFALIVTFGLMGCGPERARRIARAKADLSRALLLSGGKSAIPAGTAGDDLPSGGDDFGVPGLFPAPSPSPTLLAPKAELTAAPLPTSLATGTPTLTPILSPTPIATVAPVITATPIATIAPVITATPIATIAPVITATPIATIAPVITATPIPTVSSGTPGATESSVISNDPSGTTVSSPVMEDPIGQDEIVIPVRHYCSNVRTKSVGFNIKGALSPVLYLSQGETQLTAQVVGDLRESIRNRKLRFRVSGPFSGAIENGRLRSGKLSLRFRELGHPTDLYQPASVPSGVIGVDVQLTSSSTFINVLWATNAMRPATTIPLRYHPSGIEDCDSNASPLMLDLGTADLAQASVSLSSRLEGVLFNILNRFDLSGFAVRDQISWPTAPARNAFLALPLRDASGNESVQGVQQLFGDRTVGPDGRTAANGFEALAKFDANRDGMISAKDPVFSKLRIWIDENRDGVSGPAELRSLDQAGITEIEVAGYLSIYERDAHGNETRQRSVVATHNGYRAIFDVWFSIPSP
ncbi:MAG: hypothetical protein NDJ89_16835 [Oligoflexia bacterium]|nr:hypothetical protein [Oligoflexia bacterium]